MKRTLIAGAFVGLIVGSVLCRIAGIRFGPAACAYAFVVLAMVVLMKAARSGK